MEHDNEHSPWSILELDGATAGERDVKKAYARLLKSHRPDQDPAGFQRLQGAYQLALALLTRQRDGAGIAVGAAAADLNVGTDSPTEGGPGMPLAEAPAADLPAEFRDAQERLKAVVNVGSKDEIAAALDAFRPLMKDQPSLRFPWGGLLQRCFQGNEELLAEILPPAGVLRLIEADQVDLPQAVMVQWHRSGKIAPLEELAAMLVRRKTALVQAGQALCIARLAVLIAFTNPAQGEALANAAFEHLPLGQTKGWAMRQVDQRLAVGKTFHGLPGDQLGFWERAIFDSENPAEFDWQSREARRALEYVICNPAGDWRGYPLLQQILPASVWGQVERRVHQRLRLEERRVTEAQHSHDGSYYRQAHRDVERAKHIGWAIWIFVVILIKVVALVFTHR